MKFKLKKYRYESIIMGNYGNPIFNKENTIIGYKFNSYEFATVNSYYDNNNNLCNEVLIKEFDENTLTFNNDVIISWLDIKRDKGFTREFNNVKYYYDGNNKIYNVEKKYNCKEFPLIEKK